MVSQAGHVAAPGAAQQWGKQLPASFVNFQEGGRRRKEEEGGDGEGQEGQGGRRRRKEERYREKNR